MEKMEAHWPNFNQHYCHVDLDSTRGVVSNNHWQGERAKQDV